MNDNEIATLEHEAVLKRPETLERAGSTLIVPVSPWQRRRHAQPRTVLDTARATTPVCGSATIDITGQTRVQ